MLAYYIKGFLLPLYLHDVHDVLTTFERQDLFICIYPLSLAASGGDICTALHAEFYFPIRLLGSTQDSLDKSKALQKCL